MVQGYAVVNEAWLSHALIMVRPWLTMVGPRYDYHDGCTIVPGSVLGEFRQVT